MKIYALFITSDFVEYDDMIGLFSSQDLAIKNIPSDYTRDNYGLYVKNLRNPYPHKEWYYIEEWELITD